MYWEQSDNLAQPQWFSRLEGCWYQEVRTLPQNTEWSWWQQVPNYDWRTLFHFFTSIDQKENIFVVRPFPPVVANRGQLKFYPLTPDGLPNLPSLPFPLSLPLFSRPDYSLPSPWKTYGPPLVSQKGEIVLYHVLNKLYYFVTLYISKQVQNTSRLLQITKCA